MLLRPDATFLDRATNRAERVFPRGAEWLTFRSQLPGAEVFASARRTRVDDLWASDSFNNRSVAVEFVGNFKSAAGKWWTREKSACTSRRRRRSTRGASC